MKRIAILLNIVFICLLLINCTQKPEKYTKLVWSDEFNDSGLPDSTKWNYETGFIRNHEMQFYTKNAENARVENGNLVIEAHNDSLIVGNDTVRITSASLITKERQEWTYGRIEVRAKIPVFLGSWPAIWLLGSNISEVGWPACGEIDMMENVGYDPDTIHFNIHTKAYNHVMKTNKGQKIGVPTPQNDYHIYALEWYPEKLDFFFDGQKVFTFANEGTGADVWPYDKPHYLILNLAVGGAWGGMKGVDVNALPQQMLIDYVRVYQ
jgi:beta-glucanase (GH16 family)